MFRPGSNPLESLAIELARVGGSEPSAVAIQGLISGLVQDRTTLHLTARLALREAPAAPAGGRGRPVRRDLHPLHR